MSVPQTKARAKRECPVLPSKPSAFKLRVNERTASRLADALLRVYPTFDRAGFLKEVRSKIGALELKARIVLLSSAMSRRLPTQYPEALAVVLKTLGPELSGTAPASADGFYYWIHGHFVETNGLDHFDDSLNAMLEITKRSTAEFAVRPFINRDSKKVLGFLRQHLRAPNPHVRRFISEGTRSRLPWGQRLPEFQRDPTEPLKLLEALKADESLYVRTSVANHLGDIAKDHPRLAIETVERWVAEGSPHASWIANRALRHLVKHGDPDALAAIGASGTTKARVEQLRLLKKRVRVGETLSFSFSIASPVAEPVVVDYAIDYQLAQGKRGRKMYKLKTFNLPPLLAVQISKKHALRPITTRRYYSGVHELMIFVNGHLLGRANFTLLDG